MEFNSVQRGQWPGCQARPSRQIDTLTDGETDRQTNGPTYAKTQEKHGRTLLSGCETDLDPRISCTSCDKRGRGRPSLSFSLPVRHSPTYPSSQPSIINGRQIDRGKRARGNVASPHPSVPLLRHLIPPPNMCDAGTASAATAAKAAGAGGGNID